MQDTNDDGSQGHYTYGTTFFNHGMIPQTWEDPKVEGNGGYGRDGDHLDVMGIGSVLLKMGSIMLCRVISALQLIHQGKMDNKIICLAVTDLDDNN
jgi:inorganic pyrophosphatase